MLSKFEVCERMESSALPFSVFNLRETVTYHRRIVDDRNVESIWETTTNSQHYDHLK